MRNNFSKIALAATLGFAITLTLSCSSGSDDPPNGGGGSGGVVHGVSVNYQGETYQTVVIGTQTWMARNLNYNVSGSVCYDNDPANCQKYGRLYDWATAKAVCPSGWHLPSDAEWGALMTAVGGPSTAGTKLKAANDWAEGGNGTDDYGFSALPGGGGYSDGDFRNVGKRCLWWSSTGMDGYASRTSEVYMESLDNFAYGRSIYYNETDVNKYDYDKSALYSVRCVQD